MSCTIRSEHPTTALTVHQADGSQLEEWLNIGLIDAALTYKQTIFPNMTTTSLEPEVLLLYSTEAGSPVRSDPNYVYFDAGTEFGNQHASAYTDAGVAKNTFGSAVWTLDYLNDCGGSAYLPKKLATPHVESGHLFQLEGAPEFSRKTFLVANNIALTEWPWLPSLLKDQAV